MLVEEYSNGKLAFWLCTCYYEKRKVFQMLILKEKGEKMVGFVPGHTILDRLPMSVFGITYVFSKVTGGVCPKLNSRKRAKQELRPFGIG